MIVGLDFDGTLIKPRNVINGKLTPFELMDNAENVIRRLSKRNVVFILNTARYGTFRIPAILYIRKMKLPVRTLIFNRKPRADLYIDDHNIFCKRIDWLQIEEEINNLLLSKN